MKIFKWISIFIAGVFILWFFLLLMYFISMSATSDSPIKLTYQTKATPYASFYVYEYRNAHGEKITEAMGEFAKQNNMDVDYGSFLQAEALKLILKRKDIRVKLVNVNHDDGILQVFLYKEEFWQSSSEREHRLFFEKLVNSFSDLGLKIVDIEFVL